MALLRWVILGGKGRCRSILRVGWSWGLSYKCLGIAALHKGVPSQAAEEQPTPLHTHSPRVPLSWGAARPWPWRMLGAGSLKKTPGLTSCRGGSVLDLARQHVAEEKGGLSPGLGQLPGPCNLTTSSHTQSQPGPTTLQERRDIAKTKAFQAISGAASMRCPRLRHGTHISLLSCKAAVQAGLHAARPWAGTFPVPCLPSLAGRTLCREARGSPLCKETSRDSLEPLPNLPCSLKQRHPLVSRMHSGFVLSPVQEIRPLHSCRKPGETPCPYLSLGRLSRPQTPVSP